MGLRRLYKNWKSRKEKIKEDRRLYEEWHRNGRPVPPPHLVKQEAINYYRDKYGIDILVETGTYLGEMVEAQKKKFKQIFTIELDGNLYNNAVNKFRKDRHIKIYQGDSGEVLEKILPEIKDSALFWLDGHYSAGNTAKGELNTPIKKELRSILERNLNHVILIDDARDFKGTDDYPTIQEVKDFVLGLDPEYKMDVQDDIIRFYK